MSASLLQLDWPNQVKRKPFVDVREYAFTAGPGANGPVQTLSVGSNAISLTPLPPGLVVGGSLYVSGGSGSAEVVPITAVGANSVTVTCGNTHAAGWTIQSATGGIYEAIQANGGSSMAVFLPPTTINIRTTLVVDGNNVTLQGSGRDATILQGDLAVTPVVQFGSTSNVCNNSALKALTVSRAAGAVPVNSIGVSWKCFQYCSKWDVRITRHGIGELYTYKDTSSASLGAVSYGCMIDSCATAYMKISNAVEVHWYGGALGINGAESPNPSDAAIIITSAQANDVRFVGTQVIPRNTGTKTPYAVSLESYTDLVGLFTFESVRFENFGTAYFKSDAGSTALQDLHISNCTFGDLIDTFQLNAATQIKGSSITGCSLPSTVNLTDPLWVTITGNFIAAAITMAGGTGANAVIVGNTIVGNATFSGAWSQLTVTGNSFFGGTSPTFSSATGSITYFNTLDPSALSKSGLQIQGGTRVSNGFGVPNGTVIGSPGDLYLNLSGGAGTTLYVKESGSATNTGWIAK